MFVEHEISPAEHSSSRLTILEHLLTERDLSTLAVKSVPTLRRWRALGLGPRYIRVGASVRYRPSDIVAWLDASPVRGGAGASGDRLTIERRQLPERVDAPGDPRGDEHQHQAEHDRPEETLDLAHTHGHGG